MGFRKHLNMMNSQLGRVKPRALGMLICLIRPNANTTIKNYAKHAPSLFAGALHDALWGCAL